MKNLLETTKQHQSQIREKVGGKLWEKNGMARLYCGSNGYIDLNTGELTKSRPSGDFNLRVIKEWIESGCTSEEITKYY